MIYYLVFLHLLWGLFALRKQIERGCGKYVLAFTLNFFLAPICMIVAIYKNA